MGQIVAGISTIENAFHIFGLILTASTWISDESDSHRNFNNKSAKCEFTPKGVFPAPKYFGVDGTGNMALSTGSILAGIAPIEFNGSEYTSGSIYQKSAPPDAEGNGGQIS